MALLIVRAIAEEETRKGYCRTIQFSGPMLLITHSPVASDWSKPIPLDINGHKIILIRGMGSRLFY